MDEKITCIAQFIAKKEKTELLKQSLMTLIAPTRKEEGCMSYSLHENTEDSTILTMIEVFKNQDAFDFHSKQPYLEEFKKSVGTLIDSVNVAMYKEVQA